MKKVNNIKQLQAEKNRIAREQGELEDQIRSDWKELKVNLKPAGIIGNSLIKTIIHSIEKEMNGKRILKSTFIYGTRQLARKFVNKTVQRADRFFKK